MNYFSIIFLSILLVSCSSPEEEQDPIQDPEFEQKKESIAPLPNGDEPILEEEYNFQSDPKAVVEEVFNAARTKDYSKLSLLVDPDGESDEPTTHICAVATADKARQDEFVEFFQKGQVIGEPEINGITAVVQIKFGPDGTHEETFYLVQRKGLWYLGSI